jgi:hypothetical protein
MKNLLQAVLPYSHRSDRIAISAIADDVNTIGDAIVANPAIKTIFCLNIYNTLENT